MPPVCLCARAPWAGEYNLRLGVMKELAPELIATHQGDVRVFEGHAFIVEAAVSVGGRDIKPGARAAMRCGLALAACTIRTKLCW